MAEEKTNEDAKLQEDVKAFNAYLIEGLKKHNLGLGAVAFITEDGRIGARPQVFRDNGKTEEGTKDVPKEEAKDAEAPTKDTGLAEG